MTAINLQLPDGAKPRALPRDRKAAPAAAPVPTPAPRVFEPLEGFPSPPVGNLASFNVVVAAPSAPVAPKSEYEVLDEFARAIQNAGMVPPVDVVPDGKVHRFDPDGRGNGRNGSGWYALHLDGVPAGIFGDWRAGLTQTWCSKATSEITREEQDAWRETIRKMNEEREAETLQRQQEAAGLALQRWDAAAPAPVDHPYLARKGVEAYGIRAAGSALLVPMRDASGKLHSLQTIHADGDKRFATDGKKQGCHHIIGEVGTTLVVCEGYATGASIHEATGLPVAVAFDAGNLLPVSESLRAQYPTLALVIAADDDWKKEAEGKGNTGKDKAQKAAQAVGAVVVLPVFPDGVERGTDFNDLAAVAGVQVVGEQVKAGMVTGKEEKTATHPLLQFHKVSRKTKAVKWVVPGVIQEGVVTVAGARGAGKTTAILPLALSVAGLHAPDYPLAPHPDRWRHVIYVVEQVEQADNIIAGIVEHSGWGITWEQFEERVRIVESRRLAPELVVGAGQPYREQFTRVVDGVELLPLVVFDTQASIFEMESENDNSEASRIMALLRQQFAGLPAWIVGHVAKAAIGSNDISSLSARGAGAFEADAIANFYLTSEGEGENRRTFFHIGKHRAEPRFGMELAIKTARVLTQGVNDFGEMEDVGLRWAWVEPLEPGESREERKKTSKLASHIKTFTNAWFGSGVEERNSAPYISRSALKHYLVTEMGRTESTADAYLRPGKDGQLIHDLVQAGVIAHLEPGYIVTDDTLASSLLMAKNGTKNGT